MLKKDRSSQNSSDMAQVQAEDKVITTNKQNVDTTHNISPTPMRLTLRDKGDLDDWVEDLQQDMRKKVTGAKLFRGLIAIKDELPASVRKKLIEAIKEL
ncbi:conserved hypothetical protein [Vibrio coralliirubri]|uniref:hypothetical protein n=1 Tax=Vibrio coralliirubri TaxID=1516159 RepID=UPI000632D8CA|nr:hypothetical protein [Vibrio coralliirubri]CDU04913.1 conserved hypothetical protein [Vibrio coralliirubri]